MSELTPKLEPLFEVRHGGQVWRLYEDGRAEGFPSGAVVLNHAAPLLAALRCVIGEEGQQRLLRASEKTDAL